MVNEPDATGQQNLRAQFFDSAIKQIAPRLYKFKQALAISRTGAWKNYFYRENTDILAGGSGNTTRGIPRGAEFPKAVVKWERIQTVIEKYGLEDNISWEDIISDDIDVRNRTIIKITEGVVKAVDDEIGNQITNSWNYVASGGLQDVYIATGLGWNGASAAILDDLAHARQLIAQKNYPVNNLICFINPRDQRSIIKYLTDNGAQFPSLSEKTARNGSIGMLTGIDFVVSNSVQASWAIVVVPKRCATWKELVPLQSTTMEDKYKSVTIRAVEMGVTQVTDPLAIVRINGTETNWDTS